MAHQRIIDNRFLHFGRRLLALTVLLLGAAQVQAEDCSEFPNGVLDGDTGATAPSQINVDRHCTVRNFPAGNELDTNFSFFTSPGQNDERWLIIFDNVVHTGQMACNAVAGHKIWFTNGSSTSISDSCQNYLIPVEKIGKQEINGETTAAIGVPFTYRLILPVLFDPATGAVINTAGSVNDLHSINVVDDLNAVGADLSYVSHTAVWASSGLPVGHNFNNNGGVLNFSNFPILPAGEQVYLDITVVLEDTPPNTPGTVFTNIAKWDFGRLVDGEFFSPLPGEWGTAPPMTIAAPQLVFTKTGPATMNLAETGDFILDVQNIGNGDAWDVLLVDRFPNGPGGGMCDAPPVITGARVFAADGTSAVPEKGPLLEGVDYTLQWQAAPACELTLSLLTQQAAIGAGERLIINYQAELDTDTKDGATLTNIAGVTQYFNGDSSNNDRIEFSRPVNNGSVGTADHQDAHTLTTVLTGLYYDKSVINVTSGQAPAVTAAPGDVLRYTLRLRTTDAPLSDARFYDDLGELNTAAVFEPGSLTLSPGGLPPGSINNTNASGGTNNAGVIDISGIDLAADRELILEFEVTLAAAILDGSLVTNQADLLDDIGAVLAVSDDPNVNGIASPDIDGDEDPTRVAIQAVPPTALVKETTQGSATIGELFSYRITVPSVAHTAPLYDVQILDDLTASAADLEFVSVNKVSGAGSWTPENTGTVTSLIIEDPVNGIDIPVGDQAVIEITVRLQDTPTNVAGLTFTNSAGYTYNQLDNDAATELSVVSGVSGEMTIVEPELTLQKDGPLNLRRDVAGVFTLDIHNTGDSPAYNVFITDLLPNTADGGMCDAAPAAVTVELLDADGITPVTPTPLAGVDYTTSFDQPTCNLVIQTLTPAAVIGPDQHLLVTYEASLDAATIPEAVLTNTAAVTDWHGLDVATSDSAARSYNRPMTDGTVGVLDHEDAHTLIEFTPELIFEKTVVNVTTGVDPALTAAPGDVLRYSLRVENTSDTGITGFAIADELDRLNLPPVFMSGSLTVVTLPAGAVDNSDATGGVAGTGLLEISNLDIGGLGSTVLVEFEVQLAPVLANDSYAANQAGLTYAGLTVAISDDPNVNGQAQPDVAGDEDPTRVLIQSAPAFRVAKVSTDLTDDPDVLMAGERLRYTITVWNVGNDNATNVQLVDQLPQYATYVSGSTTLNAAPVMDDAGGSLPLIDGLLINAPQDPTSGVLNAGVADNVATITFDVDIDSDVLDGTIISNQAFVSAIDAGVLDVPSDDPDTAVADDPTMDVVGNVPLLYAEKSAELAPGGDGTTPGIVDELDTLLYTITVYNNGSTPATLVELVDALPADTTYVANTTTLNGHPVSQSDGGVFPLESGLPISSGDLTLPLPGTGEGIINPGEFAVVQFELMVNGGVTPGTLITNQAVVESYELNNLLTDGDGNPATGPEPTIVVVGDVQQLAIDKQVSVVGGGAAEPASTLEYLITVTNIGSVPAYFVGIYDDLAVPNPGYLTYVDQSATLNGSPNGVTVNGTQIVADYFNTYGSLPAGESIQLRFQATIDPNLQIGSRVTNIGEVRWNDPLQNALAEVSVDLGGMPNAGVLNGMVWHDANFDNTLDSGERVLEGWTVELFRNDQPIAITATDAFGMYAIAGVMPNYLSGDAYELRFTAPGAGASAAMLGVADSAFSNELQRIFDIVVEPGNNLLDLNLPIDPNGVVYNSISRTPVNGATVTLLEGANGTPLPTSCFDDPAQQGQVTPVDGYYKFDLNFSGPACLSGSGYTIQVTPPAGTFVPGLSELIPPSDDPVAGPFNVPACPGTPDDAIINIWSFCELQPSEFAPSPAIAARSAGTRYFTYLTLDDTQSPNSSQIFNNHIPVDPVLTGSVTITKTTPSVNVSRGQLVPYTLTVNNSIDFDLTGIDVVDRYPAGFKYVEGSARVDGVPVEPQLMGRELAWSNLTLSASGQHEIQLLLAVGAGVSEGEFVNRAQVMNGVTGEAMSEEATATVRLVPDPTFDCTDVTGKVFGDNNRNGYQDGDEAGLGGVRVVTARGLAATSDPHGRFHITCAITPNENRGSNFVMKLDNRTLPSGYRASTREVQIKRATRGKALHFEFGASIHRVVAMDLADPVFESGSTELRAMWQPRLDILLEELQKSPSVLRLSYLGDVEEPGLASRRLKAVETEIAERWAAEECCYELVIETDLHWRLGAPPNEPKATGRAGQ